jgi:hypothetical protein
MYRIITCAGMVDCSEDHSLLGVGGVELKPTDVSNGSTLLHNHCYSEGYKNYLMLLSVIPNITEGKKFRYILKYETKTLIAYVCIHIRQAGFYPHYSYSESEGVLTITARKNVPSNEIIYIAELDKSIIGNYYIYDLQTANHHFSVGPGALVVHNTDSLFVCFNPKDPSTGQPLEGQEALKETIHLTEEAGQLVTKALKAPHDFEFDKVYWPFLIFSKKRYVGHKYEELDHYTQASMGIALKRRDYAPIVKKVYGGAVEILLKEKDVPKAVDFVQRSCVELIQGKYGLGPLTISKSLRAEYANPQGVAHKVLADRMAARDPGTAPTVGDRIPFIYIQPQTGQQAADLQGDRVEHPSYIKEKSLKPDYMFYITNQISNPVIQMFGIMLEQMPGYAGPPAAGWSPNVEKAVVQRESAAYEILFRDAINAHKNSAKAQFMSLFKGAGGQLTFQPKESIGSKQKAIPIVQPPKPQAKQTLLDQFFTTAVQVDAHKQIVKAMDKKLKKGAKEGKEGKEA